MKTISLRQALEALSDMFDGKEVTLKQFVSETGKVIEGKELNELMEAQDASDRK